MDDSLTDLVETLTTYERPKPRPWSYEVLLFNRDILQLRLHLPGGYLVEFRCSARIAVNRTLADMGKTIGLPKLSYDHEPVYFKSVYQLKQHPTFYQYLKRDCLILKTFMNELINKVQWNRLRLTAGATAYHGWQRMTWEEIAKLAYVDYQPLKQGGEKSTIGSVYFTNPKTNKKELISSKWFYQRYVYPKLLPTKWLQECQYTLRQYFRGGLTYTNPEKVAKPQAKIRHFDINSSYPNIMNSDRLFPIGEPLKEGEEVPGTPTVKLYELESKTELKSRGLPFVPIYPCNYNWRQYGIEETSSSYFYPKVIKPNVRIFITDAELKLMKEYYTGEWSTLETFRFHAVRGRQLWGTYIDYWFKKKLTSEGVEKELAKLQMNSLFGKYATRSRFYRAGVFNPDFVRSQKPRQLRGKDRNPDLSIAWTPWESFSYEAPVKFYLPLAIWITSYARVELVKGVGFQFDKFLACDTDSIHCAADFDHSHLDLHPTRLGAWKEESFSGGMGIYLKTKSYFLRKEGRTKVCFASFYVKQETADQMCPCQIIFGFKSYDMLQSINSPNGKCLQPVIKEQVALWDDPRLLTPDVWFQTKDQFLKWWNEGHFDRKVAKKHPACRYQMTK